MSPCPYPTAISLSAALLIPRSTSRAWIPSPRRMLAAKMIPTHMGLQAPLTHVPTCPLNPKSQKKSGQILLRCLCSAALVGVRITDLFLKHLQWGLRSISSGSKVNRGFFSLQSCRFLTLTSQQTWDRLPGKLFSHTFSCPSVSHSHRIQASGEGRENSLADSFWATLNLSKH